MRMKGGDTIWHCWDRYIRKTERPKNAAKVGNAVNLFGGILAISILGLWVELSFPAPTGVILKYGLTAIFAVLYAVVFSDNQPADIGITNDKRAGWLLIFLFIPNGAFRLYQCGCEELIYRVAIFGTLRRDWGLTVGVVASTVFFVVMHPGAGLMAWAIQACFALFACWWMINKKEVWGIIGIHTAWNLLYDLRIFVAGWL